jgi:hypothetical protein
MKLTWPSVQTRHDFLEATISAIGRPVTFIVTTSSTVCPTCSFNPVTKLSTNPFCVTCSGNYYLPLYSGISVSGHVTWKQSEGLTWYTGGQQFTGDCRVRINYTVENLTILENTKEVIVDHRTMQVDHVNLLGAPEVNRIVISLMEKEKENGPV